MMRTILTAVLVCFCSWAQTAGESPVFEVASVKPSPPPEFTSGFVISRVDGGPGTKDPTRLDCRNMPLGSLILRAYNLSPSQLSGPDWIDVERFDIVARVPPGATQEEFRSMLRNLLVERFRMQTHRDKKDLLLYSLTASRNGPKLKPHVEATAADAGTPVPDNPAKVKTDSQGYPLLPPGIGMGMLNGRGRLHMVDADLARLVGRLSQQLGGPVKDDSGLQGTYDIDLYWSTQSPGSQAEAEPGPDLFAAVQEQLGLKLEKKKGPVEILVIDHAERTPTGN
jgi:uncharacterized protein (TIGR03435 family)